MTLGGLTQDDVDALVYGDGPIADERYESDGTIKATPKKLLWTGDDNASANSEKTLEDRVADKLTEMGPDATIRRYLQEIERLKAENEHLWALVLAVKGIDRA